MTEVKYWESQDGKVKLFCDDCENVIPKLNARPKNIDLLLTDPPYNIGYKYNNYDDNMDWKSYYAWQIRTILATKKIMKPNGSIMWLNYPETAAVMWTKLLAYFEPIKMIMWNYHQHTGGKPLRKATRTWLWMGKNEKYYVGEDALKGEYQNPTDRRIQERMARGLRPTDYDWWEYDVPWLIEQVKNVSKDKTPHPCQLPIEMVERLVRAGCPENGLTLDIYMGSGTTGVACIQSNRNFIGIEKDPTYFQIALERIQKIKC